MKNDEAIVMGAAQQHGFALQYASEEMKNDEAIVTAAVRRSWIALKYASEEMKNNEAIVMAAVQTSGTALLYASDEMKNNESFVMAAVQRCREEDYGVEFLRSFLEERASVGVVGKVFAKCGLRAKRQKR